MKIASPNRKTFLCLLPAVLAMVLFIGCSEDSNETASSSPLTRAEFVKKANQICAQGIRQKEAAIKRSATEVKKKKGTPSQEDLEQIISEVALPPVQKVHDELAELKPPRKDTAEVRRLIASLQTAVDRTEANPQALLEANPFTKSSAAAEDYGLNACRF